MPTPSPVSDGGAVYGLRCGAPTRPQRAGRMMVCSNEGCATEFFPRVDPAIIVLVSQGDRVLLGRQASWSAGRYSTIAGFVEPGESLEDAVRREVLEELAADVGGFHTGAKLIFGTSDSVHEMGTAHQGQRKASDGL